MILPGISRALFKHDRSPIRFESFCLALFSKVMGARLVPTSLNYDLGRDGRSVSVEPIYLCATLERDIDAKVASDMLRLSSTTRPTKLVYCTTQGITEDKAAKLEAEIRRTCPTLQSVQVYGETQIADLAEDDDDLLRSYYGPEIQNAEDSLLATRKATPEAEEAGLRLALFTQTTNDSVELRRRLARRLVLESLSGGEKPAGQIAQYISSFFHLPRPVSSAYILGHLRQLRDEGLVTLSGESGRLTDEGRREAEAVPVEATEKLLQGRDAIRDALQRLSGRTLTDSQFNSFWNTLQDGLANIFFSHGMKMVRMMRSLLDEEERSLGENLTAMIEGLADRATAGIMVPEEALEIRQSLVDIFSDRNSRAFAWLSDVCSIYVMLCSLGFEAQSARQMVKAMSFVNLVPDTDVVLSFLCEGEVRQILSGWKAVGGLILMTKPVLEEVAYHAWISEVDYSLMERQLSRMTDNDAQRLLENAFVRAFRVLSPDNLSRRYWNSYRARFRGGSQYDYEKIMGILRDEEAWDYLTEANEDFNDFRNRVYVFALKRYGKRRDELDYQTRDKCKRDAGLLASILAARKSKSPGQRGTVCAISSAQIIHDAEEKFSSELGEPDSVLSIASIGLLLTLVPQVAMGVDTLRTVLFDDVVASSLGPLQRFAYRVIAQSAQHDMPWSKRGTLVRQLDQAIVDESKLRGEPIGEVREKVYQSRDPEYSAAMVARALDALAIHGRDQEETDRLQRELSRIRDATIAGQTVADKRLDKRAPRG